MLSRVLEAELVDSGEEAEEYDRIDHQTMNDRFVADFLAAAGRSTVNVPPIVIDVGAGSVRLPIALCREWAAGRVIAVDMAASPRSSSGCRCEMRWWSSRPIDTGR